MKNLQLASFMFSSVSIAALMIYIMGSDKAEAASYVKASKTYNADVMYKATFDKLWPVAKGMMKENVNYFHYHPDTLGLVWHGDTVYVWEEDNYIEFSKQFRDTDSTSYYAWLESQVQEQEIDVIPETPMDYLTEPPKPVKGRNYNEIHPSKKKKDTPNRAAKRKKQEAYIKRFLKVAQKERDKYHIPVSIKLAQGLLESNVGESKLAINNNNHFGIKCFSKTCGAGHCTNYWDDHRKDFFRKYDNAWQSYRAHSLLLTGGNTDRGVTNNKRYAACFKLKTTDYKGWAHALKKAGYATDKNYAYKVIGLIEDLELYKYDY